MYPNMAYRPSNSLPAKVARFMYSRVFAPSIIRYVKKDRAYHYGKYSLKVLAGVFHPGLFFSTSFLFQYLNGLSVKDKLCLEVGCGSGLLSLQLAGKGAQVTAIDINPLAVKNTLYNLEQNQVLIHQPMRVIQSDLFDALKNEKFDLVVINPPYYFAEPQNLTEHAWYCGSEGQYFVRLFEELSSHLRPEAEVIMSLSDKCDITRIESLALQQNLKLQEIIRKSYWGELNFIFRVIGPETPIPSTN